MVISNLRILNSLEKEIDPKNKNIWPTVTNPYFNSVLNSLTFLHLLLLTKDAMKTIFILLTVFAQAKAFAVTQTARINQRIYPALDIKRMSDMYFPDAYPGSPSFTVEAGNSETAQNASFLVTGEPGKRVSVILPRERIVLQNQSYRAKIFVDDLESNVGHSGVLDNNGELKIFVGGTRREIPSRIPSGDYSGSFCVTVMY